MLLIHRVYHWSLGSSKHLGAELRHSLSLWNTNTYTYTVFNGTLNAFHGPSTFRLIKAANDGTSFGSEKSKSFMNYYCFEHNELMDTMERLVNVSHSPTHSFWYLFKRGYMQTLGIFHRLHRFSALCLCQVVAVWYFPH